MPKKHPPVKRLFRLLITLLSFLLLLFELQSCKKMDIDTYSNSHDKKFIERFFTPKNTNNEKVNRIIRILKLENERTGFVGRLPNNCGFPVWEKFLLQKQHFASKNAEDSLSELIILPLTVNNENLSAIIIASGSENGGYIITCNTTNDQLYELCNYVNQDHIEAERMLGVFMFMENHTFETTSFFQIPKDFFPSVRADTLNNGTRAIEIAPATPDSVQDPSGFVGLACWIAQGPNCNCADPSNCDWHSGCPSCSIMICEPVIGPGTSGPGYPGGSGNPPTPPGGPGPGGSGGGGGGGGNNPPGGGGCTNNFERAWYSYIIMPENPCGPVPPPTEPDVILDPCSQALLLQSNVPFRNMLQNLKNHCNNTTDETEYGFIYDYTTFNNAPSIALDPVTGVTGEKEINFKTNALLDGFAHNHYTNSLSIFSPKDIWSLCNVFNDEFIRSNGSFTISLVTASGTQYLLMIENLTKFTTFAASFNSADYKGFEIMYNTLYHIRESKTNNENEIGFLRFLNENKSGLKLFRGNSSFTEWTPLNLNGNNIVITASCI